MEISVVEIILYILIGLATVFFVYKESKELYKAIKQWKEKKKQLKEPKENEKENNNE